MRPITFIIPCAGKGSRLGAPWPKELYIIEKQTCLIDKCFDEIRPFKDESQVVIIVSEHKMEVVKYLSKYANEFNILFIYQKPDLVELGGAIKSAKEYLSEKNMILLPDLLLSDDKIHEKFKSVLEFLEEDPVAYLLKHEPNVEKLSKLGNVVLENKNIVKNIIDKPSSDEIIKNKYRDYWISFAFRGDCSETFLECFDNIMKKNRSYDITPVLNGKGVFIDEAIDLGVWENIYTYYKAIADSIISI